ncbi:hypothetical protein YC2023_117494 [Brassica napus]
MTSSQTRVLHKHQEIIVNQPPRHKYVWKLETKPSQHIYDLCNHVTRTKNDELKFSQRACRNRHKL